MQAIVTPNFRLSFPALFTPTAFDNQEPKYKITMLFPKGTDLSALHAMAKAAAAEKWPDPSKRPNNLRNPFRDGDVDKPDVAGYPGNIFVGASSKMRPGVVDQNLQPILSEDDIYAGCWCRAQVTCFAYDKAGNRGVAFGLQNLQKVRDDEPFSGRAPAETVFDALPTEPRQANAGGGVSSATEDDLFA